VPDPSTYDDALRELHLAQASTALPGPDYYTVLRWIHQILRPATYVEIGIRHGDSLRAALPGTKCVGIDPEPALEGAVPPDTRVFAMTSDRFFESYNLADVLGAENFSLAFIDGLHLFEQALLDFIHLERFANRQSIIMIHDSLPLDRTTSDRVRTTHFYSGDVWKLALCLKVRRKDLRLTTIRTGPTGLCLIARLDPHSDVLVRSFDELVAEYVALDFRDYERGSQLMPDTVENSFAAVRSCIASLLQDA
jgi:Methyltransferase domain